MTEYTSEEDIARNLQDAGCGEDTISQFIEKMKGGNIEQGLRLLEKHRRYLLDIVHEEEKKIEYLDYFVYQMKNKFVKAGKAKV